MSRLSNIYRSLASAEKLLVIVLVIVTFIILLGFTANEIGAATAQTVSAAATLVLAGLAFAQVHELRETRREQQRPHVIVDADYSNSPLVDVVLRNIGQGAAKDISFKFSDRMESPGSKQTSDILPISEQPYFKQGMDYLAPGAEIRCFWGQ